jgi:hypothetical protein
MNIKSDYYIQVNELGRYRVVRQEEDSEGQPILQVYGPEDISSKKEAESLIQFQKSLDESIRKQSTWRNVL